MSTKESGYTIKAVAARTGVSVHALRAWERRYGVPKPERGLQNHYRLYSDADIAEVLWMKQQLETGLSPRQAGVLYHERMKTVSGHSAHTPSEAPIAERQHVLQDALLNCDEGVAQRTLDESLAYYSPEQVITYLITPTMQAMGERWMQDDSGVGQEHFASNLIRQRLHAALQAQPILPDSAPLLLAACAPEETHEVGLLIFTWLARRKGWRVSYLGQRTPLLDLRSIARRARPQWIVLSVTTPLGLSQLLPLLSADQRPGFPLAFGGRLLNQVPELRERLPGMFLGEDAIAAVEHLTPGLAHPPMWAPLKRSLDLGLLLQSHRLNLAGLTTAHLTTFSTRFMANGPRHRIHELNIVTLFLIDALACATAFETPTLLDQRALWRHGERSLLAEHSLPILEHIQALNRALERLLTREQGRIVQPLLERLRSIGE